MAYSTRDRVIGYSHRDTLPPGVKWLLISNVGIYLIYFFAARTALFDLLELRPRYVVELFAVWQLVTYQFLHSPESPFHIVFNMLTLWMVGVALEQTWGTRQFLKYYFLCGIGAGACVVAASYFSGNPDIVTIGASGAIYGLLLAFGVLFPEAIILLIIFPVKAKYAVMILGAIAFLMSTSGRGGGVSHVAHLGGLVIGYLYLRGALLRRRVPAIDPVGGFRQRFQHWKRERAKRKFQVYMRKQRPDRNPRDWTN